MTYETVGVRWSGKIFPQQIEQLVAAINESRVWDIDDQHYENVIIEAGPRHVSVTLNGRSKSVGRFDAYGCGPKTLLRVTPEPQAVALCELANKIEAVTDAVHVWHTLWFASPAPPAKRTPLPTLTRVLSSAHVVITVYVDQNGNGTPEPNEMQNGIPAQLQFPDGKLLSATTQQGIATFDLSGYPAGIQITASLPNLYRSYQFYLPQTGTVPVTFSFAQPTMPTRSP